MNYFNLFIILIPIIALCVNILLKTFNKISQIIIIILQLCLVGILLYIIIRFFETNFQEFNFKANWISNWNINFLFSVNGANVFTIFSVILAFFILFVQNFSNTSSYKSRFNYLLIQISVIGAIISYDLILKLFFWELSWLPVILMLSNNKKSSFNYSKLWFLSQFFIISSLICLSINGNFSFNIKELNLIKLDLTNYNLLSFILLTIGISLRLFIYPFNKWFLNIFNNTSYISSCLILLIIPLISFDFLCQFYKIIFDRHINIYINYLTYIFFFISIPPIINLLMSKSFSKFSSYIILMFNPFIFLWVANLSKNSLESIYEIIYVKFFINLALIYFTKLLIDFSKTSKLENIFNKNKLIVTCFFASIFLSFGIPGLTLIKPFFFLFNYIAKTNTFISLSIFLIILISFLHVLKNTIFIFKYNENTNEYFKIKKINNYLSVFFILITILISTYPNKIHKSINEYYKSISYNKGYNK